MGERVIASHVPGRLRLRHASLRRPAPAEALADLLRGWPAVQSVDGNRAAGSLLILYDATALAPDRLEADLAGRLAEFGIAASAADAAPAATPVEDDDDGYREPLGKRVNRYAKIGILGSLTASLAALAVGKRAHAAFGALHVALLVLHLNNHRNRLWQ